MHILLGTTGSVAAVLTPKLISALTARGHEVQVVATKSALYFFQPEQLTAKIWTDADEWPDTPYVKDMPIEHIRLRDWADVLLIAPLSANSLAKIANGICDNLLTCVICAWEQKKPIILAPAMNTKMWDHPFTRLNLNKLAELRHYGYALTIVNPVAKQLACGDEGVGALADITDIVNAVDRATP